MEYEYDTIMEDIDETQSEAVQKVFNEAFDLFTPLAHHEWLPCGTEVLFLDLVDEVEWEEWEVAAVKVKTEAEVAEEKVQVEVEAAKAKH